jgi:hypothetical protein
MSPTNSRSSSQERTAVPSSLPGLNLQQEIAASLANSKEKADAEAAAAAAATAAIPQGSGASQTVPPRSGTLGVVDNDKNTKDKGKGKEEDVSFGAAELRRMLLENGFDPLTIAKQLEELSATPSQEETESLRLSRNPSFSHHSSEDGEASPLQRYSKTSRYVHYDDEEDRGRSPGRRPPSPRSESLPQFTTPRRHRPRSRSISPDVGTIVRDRERQHREEEARRTAKEAESRRRREEKEGKIASNSRETTKPTESNNAPTSGTVPPSTTGTVNVAVVEATPFSQTPLRGALPRIPFPQKYSGENDNVSILDTWKRNVKAYCRQIRLDPDSFAAWWTIFNSLEGNALRWAEAEANEDIDELYPPANVDPNVTQSPWTLERVYEELRRNFVDPTAHRTAVSDFEKLKQGKGSVRVFAQEILRLSSLMPRCTSFQRKKKFLDQLDADIAIIVYEQFPRFDTDEKVRFQALWDAATLAEQQVTARRNLERAKAKGENVPGIYGLLSSSKKNIQNASRGEGSGSGSSNNRSNRRNDHRNNNSRSNNDPSSTETAAAGSGSGRRYSPNRRNRSPNRNNRRNDRPRRTPAQQAVREERRKNNQCFECGGDHLIRDCPTRPSKPKSELKMMSVPSKEEKEDNGPYPRPFVVNVDLQDRTGFRAVVDTGASDSVMQYSLATALNLTIRQYRKPIRVQLGTKGSRAMASAWVQCRFQCAGVDRMWRFMLLPIEEEVIIARDFLRCHEVSLSFHPDRLNVGNPTGRPPPHIRSPRAIPASTTLPVPQLKRMEKEVEEDEPSIPLRNLPVPVFESKITPKGAELDDAYEASQEEIDEFLAFVLDVFIANKTILDKKETLPCPPHRGPDLDHRIEFIEGAPPLDPAVAYPWSRVQTPIMLKMLDVYKAGGQFSSTTKAATSPLTPVIKKDGGGRPVGDNRKRNKITKPQKMQPLDAASTINDVAAARYRFIIDLLRAFEQCRLMEEDEWKNVLATPIGNYLVKTAMQGDLNSPTCLQRNMLAVLEPKLKRGWDYYADDLVAYSNVWRTFKENVLELLTRLHNYCFVGSLQSIQCCAPETKILGRVIRGNEISMDPKQIDPILNFVRPRTVRDLQRFLGMVNWDLPFIPGLQIVAAPLQSQAAKKESVLQWREVDELAFNEIKRLVSSATALSSYSDDELAPLKSRPVHLPSRPREDDVIPKNNYPGKYLFVATDASGVGSGARLSIGENWWNARPLGYFSKKHTPAQMNYSAYKAELLAVVLAAKFWRDVLQGKTVIFVSDNKALVQLGKQDKLNDWQVQGWEVISEFDYEFEWIEGKDNEAADALSRQYLAGDPPSEESAHDWSFRTVEFKMLERPSRTRKLPERFREGNAPRSFPRGRTYSRGEGELREEETHLDQPPPLEDADITYPPLHSSSRRVTQHIPSTNNGPMGSNETAKSVVDEFSPESDENLRRDVPRNDAPQEHPTVSRSNKRYLKKQRQAAARRKADGWEMPEEERVRLDPKWGERLNKAIASSYSKDVVFSKVLSDLTAYAEFFIDDKGLLWRKEQLRGDQLCLPSGLFDDRSIREIYLEHYHSIGGHQGAKAFIHLLRAHLFWPSLASDVVEYCRSCPPCQATKFETSKPRGKMHSIVPPSNGLEKVAMDFMGPFPKSKDAENVEKDFIWSLMDVATGRVKLIPCNQSITAEGCAKLYLARVYPDWGVPKEVLSDRDPRWTASFWQAFFSGLGTTLSMSTAYHPQTNGKIERSHRSINEKLRNLIEEKQRDWAVLLPHVEIAVNSSRNASGFSPFELTNVFLPSLLRTPEEKTNDKKADVFLEEAMLRNEIARDFVVRAQIEQTHYANKHRRPAHVPALTVESAGKQEQGNVQQYWIKTKHWRTVPERSRALVPPFAGPFRCISFDPLNDTYVLDLPDPYLERGFSGRFHASQVKPFVVNDERRFPNRLVDSVPIFPLDELDADAPYYPGSIRPSQAFSFDANDVRHILSHHFDQGHVWFQYVAKSGAFKKCAALPKFNFVDSHPVVVEYLEKFGGLVGSIAELEHVRSLVPVKESPVVFEELSDESEAEADLFRLPSENRSTPRQSEGRTRSAPASSSKGASRSPSTTDDLNRSSAVKRRPLPPPFSDNPTSAVTPPVSKRSAPASTSVVSTPSSTTERLNRFVRRASSPKPPPSPSPSPPSSPLRVSFSLPSPYSSSKAPTPITVAPSATTSTSATRLSSVTSRSGNAGTNSSALTTSFKNDAVSASTNSTWRTASPPKHSSARRLPPLSSATGSRKSPSTTLAEVSPSAPRPSNSPLSTWSSTPEPATSVSSRRTAPSSSKNKSSTSRRTLPPPPPPPPSSSKTSSNSLSPETNRWRSLRPRNTVPPPRPVAPATRATRPPPTVATANPTAATGRRSRTSRRQVSSTSAATSASPQPRLPSLRCGPSARRATTTQAKRSS